MRHLLDRLLGWIADVAAFGWFRSVEVAGRDRFPHAGPVVVVANHGGGFVDPALLASVLPRLPRFLATASLWRHVIVRPLLAFAGAIPVFRAVDGPTADNRGTFDRCHEVLRDGGVVALFPEGRASDATHLLPVKTGAARIALGARAAGVGGVAIVPVGLMYEDKASARSRAYVRVGPPLVLDEGADTLVAGRSVGGEDDREAVRALTHEVETRLSQAALAFHDAAELDALATAAEVALRPADAGQGWTPPLSIVEELAARLAGSAGRADVRSAADAYREALEANAVGDPSVASAAEGRFHRVHLLASLLTVIGLPFALAGLVVNGVPGLLVHLSGRPTMAPVTRATVKFLLALVAFPITWMLCAWFLSGRVGHPWILTAFLGPLCGLVALWVLDRILRARRARLDVARLTGPRSSLSDLRERRARLVEAVTNAVGRVRPVAGGRGLGSPERDRW